MLFKEIWLEILSRGIARSAVTGWRRIGSPGELLSEERGNQGMAVLGWFLDGLRSTGQARLLIIVV